MKKCRIINAVVTAAVALAINIAACISWSDNSIESKLIGCLMFTAFIVTYGLIFDTKIKESNK